MAATPVIGTAPGAAPEGTAPGAAPEGTAPGAAPEGTAPPDAGSEHSGGLRELAVRGGAYLAGREALGMAVRLAGLVIVVRHIGPSAFGIYSAAAAYVLFPVTLAQLGAEVFLIRLAGPIPRRRYDEVFTVLLVTSLAVTALGLGLTFAAAPLLRPFGVLLPLRVLLLTVPVNVLWAPAQAAIERTFAYRRMGLLELGGDVALYGTAVPLALRGAGAWSLVAGYFAWQGWLLVGSYAMAGMRPRLRWSNATARDLLGHGTSYSLGPWIMSARSSIVVMIVGTYAGAAGVGYVTFALRLVATLNFTERGMQRVGMVAISRKISERSATLARALEEGSAFQMLVAVVPFASFGVVATWVVPHVFGPAWRVAIPLYALAALAAVLHVPASVQRVLLLAHGKNLAVAWAGAVELVLLCAAAALAVPAMGIDGFGVASLVAVASTAVTHVAANRLVPQRYGRVLVPLAAFGPLVAAPLVPLAWWGILVLPAALSLSTPAGRREVATVATTVRHALGRRTGPRPEAPTPPVPVTLAAAGGAATVSSHHRSDGAVVRVGTGGPEMGQNGLRAHTELDELAAFRVWRWDGEPGPATAANGWAAAGTDEGNGAAAARSEPTGWPEPAPAGLPAATEESDDALASLLAPSDPVTGLPSAAVLLGRLGRRLGATGEPARLLLVAVEVAGWPGRPGADQAPSEWAVAAVAAALRAALRFDDLVARVGPRTFVAVLALAAGGTPAYETAAHLQLAAGGALGEPADALGAAPAPRTDAWPVRAAYLEVDLPTDQDPHRLVADVVDAARA